MTPEELQRTMDFIIEHQARFAVAIEQEREERLEQSKRDQPRIAQVEAAIVRLDANLIRLDANLIRLTELAEIQSRRLDQHNQDINRILSRRPEQE